MAAVALFVALGAGAIAAQKTAPKNSVTSRSIKNGAVQGVDVADNGLNGTDIDESTLGKVGSAQSADTAHSADSATTAQSAATAQTVASQVKIDQRGGHDSNFTSIASIGGMNLRSRCTAPNAGETELELNVVTNQPATVNSDYQVAFGGPGVDPPDRSESAAPVVIRGAALNSGTTAVVPAKSVNATDALNDASSAPNTFIQTEGQIIYRTDANVVTVVFHTFTDHTGANTGFCEVTGTATKT